MWIDGTEFNWSTKKAAAYRTTEITGFPRHRGKDVPAGTVAAVRSLDAWRALEGVTALSTLIRRRHLHLTPSCGRHTPYRGENSGPGKDDRGELDTQPGIKEQHRPKAALTHLAPQH